MQEERPVHLLVHWHVLPPVSDVVRHEELVSAGITNQLGKDQLLPVTVGIHNVKHVLQNGVITMVIIKHTWVLGSLKYIVRLSFQ